jgi:hypothetical protein
MRRSTRVLATALLALPVAAATAPVAAQAAAQPGPAIAQAAAQPGPAVVQAAAQPGPAVVQAASNGLGRTPVLGWSSWSFVRNNPTAAGIEAQADAMKSSGLGKAGFQYVNMDDFWYQCPGSQGPNVDQYGRWVIDSARFPDGIKAVADHVHRDGFKFGIYVTPGISRQAVAQNTAIEGTGYHADDIATTDGRSNYNCGGMVGIDYTKPSSTRGPISSPAGASTTSKSTASARTTSRTSRPGPARWTRVAARSTSNCPTA